MSETVTQEAPKKAATVYTPVKMEDGTTVEFAGDRKVSKTITIDEDKAEATIRFDFRNGAVKSISTGTLPAGIVLRALAHGISQKVSDDYAGVKEVEDMALSTEEMIARLQKGDWGATREAGDSLSGASVVIRAIIEAKAESGQTVTVEQVKTFLQGKIDAAKARGEKLSRQELYASFRAPGSKTAAIIKRLEEAKAAKTVKVNSDDLLGEM